MSPKTSTSLAPGFRFHPTDEELVRYYLRRKLSGKPFKFDAISEIDIYKVEPWDLPGKSRLKTRDLEWYFFSVLDKKYGNGSRTNRATDGGYWKTTGKDRDVYHRSQVVGMKKTLVYHIGRAPKGQRTNWVMHEYRLIDEELEKAGIVQDAFVLCRVFQKSGSGPKNGERYGAPFVEEEWEEDESEMVPKEESAEEVEVVDDAYLEGIDLEQILATGIPSDDIPVPLNIVSGENVSFGEETADFDMGSGMLPLNFYSGGNVTCNGETTDSNSDSQKLLVGSGEYQCVLEQSEDQNSYNLPLEHDMHEKPVKHEYIGEPSNTVKTEDVSYLLDEPYMDAWDNLQFDDGAFLEANDLANPICADSSGFGMLEDYLTYFDANDDISQHIFDPPETLIASDAHVSRQASVPEKDVKEETQPAMQPSETLFGDDGDVASSSKQEPTKTHGTDFQYPFIKQASRMLGSFPAPPAFASEFPSKDVTLRPNPASLSSSTAHVTAGMIQIGNTGLGGHGMDWYSGKHGRYNIVLSFGLSRGDDNSTNLESIVSIRPGKTASGMSRDWFYLIFFWVLILSVSFKIGTIICAS